tara:strand:- start:1017 stop:2564 length:1548 start_codon:yes stop_codon:yes gene_type:complete
MTDFQNETFLPIEPEDEINQSVEYLAARQPVQSSSHLAIKITPSNGGVFTKDSEFIEMRLNPQHNTFVDGTSTLLNFTFTAKPVKVTADATFFNCHSAGQAMGLFKRITVSVGGLELENITNQNRIFYIMSGLYANGNQLRSSNTVSDLFGVNSGESQANRVGRLVAGVDGAPTSATPTEIPIKVSVPITLSALLGPGGRKCLPIGMLREAIVVRFYTVDTSAEAYYALSPTAGTSLAIDSSSNFEIKNVSMEVKAVRFDDRQFEYIRNNTPDNMLTWDATTFICNNNNVAPQNANTQTLLGNTNYVDVKSVVFGTYYSQILDGKTLTYESVFPGLFRANVLLNGQPVLARPIGVNNTSNLNASVPQFMANLISVSRNGLDIFEANTCAVPTDVNLNTGQNQSYSPYATGGVDAGGIFPIAGPQDIPNSQGPWTNKTAGVPITPAFFVWGLSLLNSQDVSRKLVGRNLIGKQVVVEMTKHNAIGAEALSQVLMSILTVGVKYHLDVRTGELRRTL